MSVGHPRELLLLNPSLRGPPYQRPGSCQMIGPRAINSSPCANRQNHSLFLSRPAVDEGPAWGTGQKDLRKVTGLLRDLPGCRDKPVPTETRGSCALA